MKFITIASVALLSSATALRQSEAWGNAPFNTPDPSKYEAFDTFFLPKNRNVQKDAALKKFYERGDRRWDLMVFPSLVFGPAWQSEFNDHWYYPKSPNAAQNPIRNKDQESRATSLVQVSNQDKLFQAMSQDI